MDGQLVGHPRQLSRTATIRQRKREGCGPAGMELLFDQMAGTDHGFGTELGILRRCMELEWKT